MVAIVRGLDYMGDNNVMTLLIWGPSLGGGVWGESRVDAKSNLTLHNQEVCVLPWTFPGFVSSCHAKERATERRISTLLAISFVS